MPRILASAPPSATKSLSAALVSSLALSVAAAAPAHAAEPARSQAAVRPAGLTASAAVPANPPVPTHTVAAGDTVFSIAQRHGLSTGDVLSWNGLSWGSSTIRPGQVLALAPAAAPAPAPTPASPAPAPPAATHTIVAGDTIIGIAARHGMSVQALLDANGLQRSSIIYPGQTLTIPGASIAPAASVSPAPAPAPAPATPAPAPVAEAHTVVAGDTLIAIAGMHGIGLDALLSANGLDGSSIIYPGQTLAIPSAALAELDAEQIGNARTIVRIGRELGVPDRGIAVALGTAMVESWLRNLDWGDRDSLGLFQQRPSQGWGTDAEVRDVDRATRVFFGGPADPNGSRTRGLLDVPGWEATSFADAAQSVQISAYPDRYAQWEQPAFAWLAALG